MLQNVTSGGAMPVARGHIEPDKTYVYTCGRCRGRGAVNAELCTDCYNGKLDRLLVEFAVARGERYYALLKSILRIQGRDIYLEASRIRDAKEKFTPFDLGTLMLKFHWPENRMKPLAEWLEETQFMPTGMYSHLQEQRFKVKDAMSWARQEAAREYFYPDGKPEFVYCTSCGRAASAGKVRHENACKEPSEQPVQTRVL
jgi:hypothetical protein